MTLLPYALEFNGKTEEEIERCYWEVHERLYQYLFSMRLALGIRAPISLSSDSKINISIDSSEEQKISEEQNESKEAGLSDFNSIFGA